MEPAADQPRPGRRRGPRGTENVSGREYIGCGLWAAAFLVLVVLSFSVGLMLRADGGPVQEVLTTGGSGDGAWTLVGSVDEDVDEEGNPFEEPCVRLFRAGQEDEEGAEITGQCGFTDAARDDQERPYVVTSTELADGTTLVFAPVPEGADAVRLQMADGSRPTVEARRSDGADLNWFLHRSEVAVGGPAQLLDPSGAPLDPP